MSDPVKATRENILAAVSLLTGKEEETLLDMAVEAKWGEWFRKAIRGAGGTTPDPKKSAYKKPSDDRIMQNGEHVKVNSLWMHRAKGKIRKLRVVAKEGLHAVVDNCNTGQRSRIRYDLFDTPVGSGQYQPMSKETAGEE